MIKLGFDGLSKRNAQMNLAPQKNGSPLTSQLYHAIMYNIMQSLHGMELVPPLSKLGILQYIRCIAELIESVQHFKIFPIWKYTKTKVSGTVHCILSSQGIAAHRSKHESIQRIRFYMTFTGIETSCKHKCIIMERVGNNWLQYQNPERLLFAHYGNYSSIKIICSKLRERERGLEVIISLSQ